MNLKLKRLVRTTSSEQYALFDLDQVDVDQQPMTIGKLDMHYTPEGVYGTILLWDDASRELAPQQRQDFVRALLDEISQPMGVPNEFVVEFFAPTLDDYEVFHNLGGHDEEGDASDADFDDVLDADPGASEAETSETGSSSVESSSTGPSTTEPSTTGTSIMDAGGTV